ncbi:MAG: site-2 protease family protein [Gammaproteobacteria bacterium]|nr:site-2 protease family protein [Gammaproteobacteria bacterium]MCH9763638.1 site-2 protease family protein [Gammaproteobacteria bacterium]
MLSIIQTISVWTIPVLLAITLHEAAHAYAAHRLGDSTAKMMGRLSLNPIRHIDLVGTIVVPILVGIFSHFQFIFGWAKPVPINYNQLKQPRRDMALVAAAGPLSNLAMALFWASVFKIGLMLKPETSMVALFLALSGQAGILINLILAFLNLIPIPPLDGSRVVTGFLPPHLATQYLKIEPFGFIIILALLATNILSFILSPLIVNGIRVLNMIFSLH